MATRDFSKYFLYRWRYVIGYSLIGLILAGLLVFAGFFLPGGLSQLESAAIVKSASLSLAEPSTLAITNLPYHALQAAIFAAFGVSVFTVKLPSLIFALLSAIGLVLLLRRWFKPNVAVIASLIAVTTGQYLFIAQQGNPSVLYIFWPIVLLLLGTQITRVRKYRFLWKVLFAVVAALSLYTPLGVYPLLAITLAVIFHPHLRAIIRKLSRLRLTVTAGLFIIIVAPLIGFISINPQLGMALLVGSPEVWPPNIAQNTLILLDQYFYFWRPSSTEVMAPFFGLGSALLILLGLYRLVRTRETTRSYLIIFWLVCLIPVLLLNPVFTSVTFVPAVLMLAAGFMSLIGYWYRLFPLNPYARVAGLVPIIILVAALISTGLMRYAYGYQYNTVIAPLFSQDIRLLPDNTNQLVVADEERAFYEAIAKYDDGLEVTDTPTAETVVVTQQARQEFGEYTVTRIITNDRSNEADRFYIMQREQ